MAPPFGNLDVQVWVDSLHQFPLEQSPSTLQAPGASQVPLMLHA